MDATAKGKAIKKAYAISHLHVGRSQSRAPRTPAASMSKGLRISSFLVRSFAIVVPLLLSVIHFALAQGDPRARTDIDKALAEQLYREQQANRACKVAVCETVRGKNRFLKGVIEWPWGNAQCEGSFAVERQLIIAAVSGPKYEAKVGRHDVVCHIETKDAKERHTVNLTIDPIVTFENGKATKAALRWGNVSGPTIVTSALWSATAIDNAFNVLQGTAVEKINEFLGPGCDEALGKW